MNHEAAASARVTVDRICDMLDRSMNQLKTHVQVDGRLDQGDQHAYRVLESRKRLLNRLWVLIHDPDSERRENARIELSLPKSDDGTLLQLGEKLHGQGRLDCRACDVEEKVEGSGILSPAARLCVVCQKGIQHVYTVQEYPGGSRGTGEGEMNALRGGNEGLEGSYRAGHTVFQLRQCDYCGVTESKPVGVTVAPKKETWKVFKL